MSDAGAKPARLVLHIDRLVLHGVADEQREPLVRALREALAAEFAKPGIPDAWSRIGHRAGLCVPLAVDSGAIGSPAIAGKPAAVATSTRQLARAAARALAQGAWR
jgi:hypothetical protein